jgi:hypothetical protein
MALTETFGSLFKMSNILGHGYVTIKQEEEQKPLKEIYLKNGASWAVVQQAYIKSGDQWIRVFPTPRAIANPSTTYLGYNLYTTFQSNVQTVSITNSGDEVLTINSATVSNTAKFNIETNYSGLGSQLPYTINPGITKSFDVQLSGTDVGSGVGSIVLNTDTGVFGANSISISVDADVLPLFSVAGVNTQTINLRYDENAAEPTGTITISNSGNGVLTISDYVIANNYISLVNAPSTVAPGKSVSFTYGLSTVAKALGGGIYSDQIDIVSDSISGTIRISADFTVVPHGSITFRTNGSWTVPAGIGNAVTVEIQGAPGAPGGNDSAPGGAEGYGGYLKFDALLSSGQTVEAWVGTAGSPGSGYRGNAPGGAGGTNALGIGNGGAGSNSGPAPWSGAGGGGGAATIAVFKSGSTLLARAAAGGGGGGGGGGNGSVGLPGNTGIGNQGQLYARSDGRWAGFQNTYAVWPTTGNEVASYTIYRYFTATEAGTYYFRSSVDNSGSIYIDGDLIGGTVNFNSTPSPVARTLAVGRYLLRFDVANGGDVAGIAVSISNAAGQVVWDTRTYAADPPGEYYSTGGAGQPKGGDGGGAGGGGGGYPGGFGGSVRGGDTGGYGGYRGKNAIAGAINNTLISDTTKAGSAYIKLTW